MEKYKHFWSSKKRNKPIQEEIRRIENTLNPDALKLSILKEILSSRSISKDKDKC